MSVVTLTADFCFNTIIISFAVWSVLKVLEKGIDIMTKFQEYENKNRNRRISRIENERLKHQKRKEQLGENDK